MLLRKVLASKTLAAALRLRFSSHAVASHDSHSDAHHDSHGHGHGPHKPYDWRDDPKLNKELEENIQNRGWDPENYSYPYEGKMPNVQVYPENYDASNLKMTFYPERKKNEHVIESMPVFYLNKAEGLRICSPGIGTRREISPMRRIMSQKTSISRPKASSCRFLEIKGRKSLKTLFFHV